MVWSFVWSQIDGKECNFEKATFRKMENNSIVAQHVYVNIVTDNSLQLDF
jgi:hypothetical protein